MARLPDKFNLSGPASLRSGRTIASIDESGIGRGIAQAGAGLQSLSGDLTDIAVQNRRDGIVLEGAHSDGGSTKDLYDFKRQFDTDTDYGTFGPRFEAGAKAIRDKWAAQISDPKARQLWAAGFDNRVQSTRDSVIELGNRRIREGKLVDYKSGLEGFQSVIADADVPEAERANAKANANAWVDAASQQGLLTPSEADEWRQKVIEGGEFVLGQRLIERDPSAVGGYSVITDIHSAMESVESSGDPTAESPVGASGLMQVMPATAKEIAAELGDENFPMNGSDAQIKAYLKDKAVSRSYGQHYFGKMLDRYDGDTEAALVAYNGGPDRADEWVASGKNDSVLPAETADYYKKVLSRAGTGGTRSRDFPIVLADAKGLGRLTQPDISGVQPEVMSRFKQLQSAFGQSLPIASGYRDKARNAKAGGAKHSRHIKGDALDIDVSGMSREEQVRLIKTASSLGFGGIGVYGNSIHIDAAGRRAWGPNHERNSVPGWAEDAIKDHEAGKGARLASVNRGRPDWYANQSPDNQLRLENMAAARDREIQVESRGRLDIAVENAPAAIRSTGSYDGTLPGPGEFAAAYGPEDGAQKYEQFSAAVDVAQKTFDFQTMSANDIMQVVADAEPTSSGDDAALQEKRHAVLESAAAASIKARNDDPVVYTQQAFPAVGAAWQAAQQSGDYQAAMTATAAAQRQLGIADMQLLPGVVADGAVATFKDVAQKTEQQRIGAIANLVFATADPEQRTAVFEQLVKAGLPEITAGAVRATARGDMGASRRLFEASMVDVSTLAGKLPNTTAEIDEAIQSEIMDVGQIGDIYYGLSDGAADNYLTAQRDSKLMSNAVHMRIRKGEALEDAVQAVAKDLYGDIVPVNASNAQILVPADTDPDVVLRGLTASQPKLREAMERTMTVPDELKGADRALAIAQRDIYIDQVMSEGYWRNSDKGYTFINPFKGLAVADENSQPLVVTDKEAQTAAPPTEQQFPTMGTDYERQLMEDRARRAGQFGQ